MCIFFFLFFFSSFLKLPVCIFFYFIIVMEFADIVAVIIDDIDNDCFLMMISWLFNIGLYAVFSFSPAPPAASEAEAVCSQRYASAVQQGHRKHCRSQTRLVGL